MEKGREDGCPIKFLTNYQGGNPTCLENVWDGPTSTVG